MIKNNCPKYSIIIPHHNLPSELQRCLNTIPSKEDIEVIIIDDTSNAECRQMVKGIESLYPKYKFLYTQSGKGAGHARNIGLKEAKGKWLIFVDCDDLLTKDCYSIWSEYFASTHQIIYFKTQTIDPVSLKYNNAGDERIEIITRLQSREKALHKWLRTSYTQPWGKMINREFIKNNNILFEESLVANDYYFSVKSGLTANSISYVDKIFYLYSIREGSLSNNQTDTYTKIVSRLSVYYQVEQIFSKNGVYLRPYRRFIQKLKDNNQLNEQINRFCEENGFSSQNTKIQLFKAACMRIIPMLCSKLRLPYNGF